MVAVPRFAPTPWRGIEWYCRSVRWVSDPCCCRRTGRSWWLQGNTGRNDLHEPRVRPSVGMPAGLICLERRTRSRETDATAGAASRAARRERAELAGSLPARQQVFVKLHELDCRCHGLFLAV